MNHNRWLLTGISTGVLLLSGCTTFQPRQTVFNPEAPRMSTIYSSASGGTADPRQRAVISNNPNPGGEAIAGYTREAQTETQQLFPEIANPVLVMFVFPHISAGRVPVPGFSTPFTLYEKTSFALPGELQ